MPTIQPIDRIQAYTVSCPANTPKTAPIRVDTSFDAGLVVGLELEIPDGHAGLTGLQVLIGGNQWIPYTPGEWIVGNNAQPAWPLTAPGSLGSYSVRLYNTDIYLHSWYLRYLISDQPDGGQPGSLAPLATPLIV